MRMGTLTSWTFVLVAVVAVMLMGSACTGPRAAGDAQPAATAISTNGLVEHIAVLSSDKFEGRAPGTPGENLTVDYLVSEYKRLGLRPGNPDGTYIQKVPLAGFT